MTDPLALLLSSLVAKSTLIALVAAIVVASLKALHIGASARHMVWLLALAAIALLPLLSLVLPQLVIVFSYQAAGLPRGPDLSIPGDHFPDRSASIWIWCAYGLGAGGLLLHLASARYALTRLWRQAQRHRGSLDLRELATLCGVRRTVEVRVAAVHVAPMTWGDRILLPPGAVDWPASRERDVLMHELSHMARRDSLTQLLAAIVRALSWFSPAVWLALRALRVEQEHACDERVLALGAAPTGYAKTLLDVAAGVQPPSLGMGVSTAMVQRSNLERRVLAILAPVRGRSLGLTHSALLGAVLLGSSALIAAVRPVDSARVLPPLGPLTTTLAPMSSQLAPLPPLSERLRLPDESNSNIKR